MTLKWSILDPFGVSGTLRSIDLEVWDAQIPGSGHLGTLEMADLDPFGV